MRSPHRSLKVGVFGVSLKVREMKEENMVQLGTAQFVYALISAIVVVLVIAFGVWGSNYVPRQREKLAETEEGGQSDVPTD